MAVLVVAVKGERHARASGGNERRLAPLRTDCAARRDRARTPRTAAALRPADRGDGARATRPARPRRAAARQGARRAGRAAGRPAARARRCCASAARRTRSVLPSRRVRGLHLIGCCRRPRRAGLPRSPHWATARRRVRMPGGAHRRPGRRPARGTAAAARPAAATGCTSATRPRPWSAWATASRRPCCGRCAEGHPRARTVAAHLCGIGGVRAAAPLLVTLLESHDDPTVAAAAAAARSASVWPAPRTPAHCRQRRCTSSPSRCATRPSRRSATSESRPR